MNNLREYFDFEKHGRSPDRYPNFAKDIRTKPNDIAKRYSAPIMVAGVCGGERDLLTQGQCLSKSMPLFVGCAKNQNPAGYMPDNILPVPFFYGLFKRPGPKLVQYLSKIRKRLDLPELEDGIEEHPGQMGLYTPGYVIKD